MIWKPEEVLETIRMVSSEHLDIRTVTMGISLLGAPSKEPEALCDFIRSTIMRNAERLIPVCQEIEERYGVPITNKRISITPISLILEGCSEDAYVRTAKCLDETAEALGVDYLAGFSCLVHKGATTGDVRHMASLPEVMSVTNRLCASVNVASTKSGINMDAIKMMGTVIKETAAITADTGASGCARMVVFSNVPEDNPFVAGAFHGIGEPECVINVGVSGPGVVRAALQRWRETHPGPKDLTAMAEVIKKMAFKITRAGELIGREVVRSLPGNARFGIMDLSLAPTPAIGDSVANILEEMGLERAGAHGSTAALAMMVDAVKKGGAMASSHVGGLSGAFIPVSEDQGMIEAVQLGAMSLDKLEALTSVCSVGLDMVAVPGYTPADTLSGIIADIMAIGVINHKTTGVRIIPLPGSVPGDTYDYGGLLGKLIVQDVNKFSSSGFVQMGGRIPAPIHSLRN
jgi:uncharacterized protein (UPF0210 family)